MRMKYIVIGALLIITGVILFLFGYIMLKNAEAYKVDGTSTSKFLIMTTYQMGQIISLSGIVVLVIGVCSGIIGSLIPEKKSSVSTIK